MNPNYTTRTQAFLKIVRPTYGIGPMLGTELVWGPLARRFYQADHKKELENHKAEVLRLQAAWKKWPRWQRGGRGLSEAEMDACKQLASMVPEERAYVLSIRFHDS